MALVTLSYLRLFSNDRILLRGLSYFSDILSERQRPPRPDLKAAAAKLGVTEQQLIDALGIPPRPQSDDQAPPSDR